MFYHLKEVNMSYYQHFIFSTYLSIRLFTGSMKALLHAIYPDSFVTSTTDLLEELKVELNKMK